MAVQPQEVKGNKAAATTGLAAPKGDGKADKKEKGTGAPRARKYEYGITDAAKISRLVDTASVKRDIQSQFALTEGNPTVASFKAKGGNRHGLRVMMRRKLIELVHADGKKFPQAYVKIDKPKEEKKPEAPKKAA